MSEPIVPRDFIAQQADAAARRFAQTGGMEWNPYPAESAAAKAWKAAFERYLLVHSLPEAEASA